MQARKVAFLTTDNQGHHILKHMPHQSSSLGGHTFFDGLWTHMNPLQFHHVLHIRRGGFWLVQKTKDMHLCEGWARSL